MAYDMVEIEELLHKKANELTEEEAEMLIEYKAEQKAATDTLKAMQDKIKAAAEEMVKTAQETADAQQKAFAEHCAKMIEGEV